MVLSAIIFLVVTLGLVALYHLVTRYTERDRARAHKRILEEVHAEPADIGPGALYGDLDVLSLAPAEEYALLRGTAQTLPPPAAANLRSRLEALLQQSQVPLSLKAFLGIVAGVALALALTGAFFLKWAGAAGGLLVGAALPFVVLHCKRKAWQERFQKQLPSAFELMARVIRAGQSVPQAFKAVAEAFEEPLAGEFSRCQQQQDLGLRAEVVLHEMARRSGILELRIFVMALLIQRQTGGNLSEVLDRLATLIRNRLRLRQQVRTLTAEGRLQGWTLVCLPFVVFAAMFFLNRPYALALLDHVGLLLATAACMAVGVVWIRTIVNFQP
jgi:tight adherence protein B